MKEKVIYAGQWIGYILAGMITIAMFWLMVFCKQVQDFVVLLCTGHFEDPDMAGLIICFGIGFANALIGISLERPHHKLCAIEQCEREEDDDL